MPKRTSSPRCTVCVHPERWHIELGRAGGATLDALAKTFKVGRDAIDRHFKNHVSAETKASLLAGPVQLHEIATKAKEAGISVLDQTNADIVTLNYLIATGTKSGESGKVARLIEVKQASLDRVAKITGELTAIAANTVNIQNNIVLTQHPEYLRTMQVILKALASHPDARADVVAALRSIEAGAPKVIEHVKLPGA